MASAKQKGGPLNYLADDATTDPDEVEASPVVHSDPTIAAEQALRDKVSQDGSGVGKAEQKRRLRSFCSCVVCSCSVFGRCQRATLAP